MKNDLPQYNYKYLLAINLRMEWKQSKNKWNVLYEEYKLNEEYVPLCHWTVGRTRESEYATAPTNTENREAENKTTDSS